MANVAVGMGQRPGGERVRTEAGVHEGKRAHQELILQVLVVRRHLMRQQQPLVHDGVRRQARDIEVVTPLNGRFADGLLHPFANDIELAFKLPFIEHVTGDKHLPDKRLGAARYEANRIVLDRHIAPTKEPSTLLADNSGKERLALLSRIGLGREKHNPDAILPGIGQKDPCIAGRTLEELVWYLKQNPGAVSRARVTTLRPSVTKALKNLKPLLNNGMGFLALDVDNKTDPTGVFLLFRVVEALLRWKPRDAHRSYLVKTVGVYATGRRLHQRGDRDG